VRRASRVAALGAVTILLAAGSAVSALYVPGVALLVLVLGAEASVRVAARRASVRLELGERSVEEGRRAALAVHAGGWSYALSRGALMPLPGAAWRPVGFRGTVVELALRPARRGEHAVGPATVRFGDPFGICRREIRSAEASLLVLPRVERIRREHLERALGLGRARALLDDGPDVDGLRSYRPGAPASDEALDRAVRAAASLCVGIAGVGGCSLLLPGAQEAHAIRPDLASWPYLHERLARVRSGVRPVWTVARRARSVVWVGAGAPEDGRGAVSCTVSPLPRKGAPVLFEIAGCAVQPAGRSTASAA